MNKYFSLIFVIIISIPFIFANNGVWHDAEDITFGIFGSDEVGFGLEDYNYSFGNGVFFIKPITILDNIYFNSNALKNCSGKLYTDSDGKISCGINSVNWSEIGNKPSAFNLNPPICTGSNMLQWSGSSWICTSSISCTTHSSYSCYSGNVYWYDSCGTRETIKESCSSGCTGSSCLASSCTTHSSYSCYSGNVYWYNSCGTREGIKESCSSGCTGSTCNAVLAWYQKYPGTFTVSIPNTINTASITISSTGALSGTYREIYYQYNDPVAGMCYYPYMSSTQVLFTANKANCPQDGKWYPRSTIVAAGATLTSNTYSMTGNVNSAGAISGTWTLQGYSYTGTISGQGAANGQSIALSGSGSGNQGTWHVTANR